jgi:hypothetical protein
MMKPTGGQGWRDAAMAFLGPGPDHDGGERLHRKTRAGSAVAEAQRQLPPRYGLNAPIIIQAGTPCTAMSLAHGTS